MNKSRQFLLWGALCGGLATFLLSAGPSTILSAETNQTNADAELAKKLANPIASLISVPIQYNYDEGYGPNGDGAVHRINVQPVIPFSISEGWNLITRTIIPFIDQEDLPLPGFGESGLGDTVASESTYDWEAEAWSIPLVAQISQLLKLGNQPIQLGVGARYWADSPNGGPESWGARIQLTFLFPK